ncbi:MAG: hypothetical protein LUE27_01605 [Clostridia bacterium]|nr:hypothetical protein [Clostridia bacterium]
MRSSYVAVLDIRSSDITAVVGDRGVNSTFIIKSKYTAKYDGYAEGDLLDLDSFKNAVANVISRTLASNKGLKSIYIGVPGEFLRLINHDEILSFESVKRITPQDEKELRQMATPVPDDRWVEIRHGCLYYVLSDKRKVINPIGSTGDSLQGRFCFYMCSRAFIACVQEAFKPFPQLTDIRLIPSVHAEAMYLIEPEKRDEVAVLFDLGYISSSYSVICGNGLLYTSSFSVGIGHIAFFVSEALEIPFEVASTFITTVNLNARENYASEEECMYEGKLYQVSTTDICDKIRDGLDFICSSINECSDSFRGANISGKPINITGEGVKVIRGAADHIASRLEKGIEIVAPKVPYYDKPQYSSTFSLLNMALDDARAVKAK